jgi:hypothetical protein
MNLTRGWTPSPLQAGFSTSSSRTIASPISPPPIIEAIVPRGDMAPFVPAGTCFNVVMRMGFDFDRMPSSEANVSPRQHPNCPRATNKRRRLHPFPSCGESAQVTCELYSCDNVSNVGIAKLSHEWVNMDLHTKHAINARRELQRTY